MVGDRQVVVYCLGDSYHAHIVALRGGVFGYFICCVLGVVPADIEEETNIVRFEDFDNSREILLAFELVAAGSECGARCVTQPAHGLLGFLRQIDEFLIKNAFDAV